MTEAKKLTIEQVRARRAELAAEKAKADEASELERETLELEMDEREAELREKHLNGGIGFVRTVAGLVALQRPRHVEFQRFVDKADFSNATVLKYVRPCVVYPDATAFDALLREYPGVVGQLSDKAAELAGVKVEKTKGK